ncbi:MAG: hypothetical protein HYW27_02545 [Candidatus Aenigmarchaeota archaeon]|nr:hypothetical protein [Candidatus Aenigmarchaeota archaeon]
MGKAIRAAAYAGLFLAGLTLGEYLSRPRYVMMIDMTGDGMADAVVSDISGRQRVFTNNTYFPLPYNQPLQEYDKGGPGRI